MTRGPGVRLGRTHAGVSGTMGGINGVTGVIVLKV